MTNDIFWTNIKIATKALGIPASTYRTWKNRGSVPKTKCFDVFNILKDTEYEITADCLSNFSKKHNPTSAIPNHPETPNNFPRIPPTESLTITPAIKQPQSRSKAHEQ